MTPTRSDLYVSPRGNDEWSGRYPEPDAAHTDGPFASIAGAQGEIRRRKASGLLSGPVKVWVRGGRYEITNPMRFTPDDSGPISYTACPGEHPVFDGARRIDGWRVTKHGDRRMWTADVPKVMTGDRHFRQLFVNGKRRPRPRLPKEGFYWMADVPGIRQDSPLFKGSDTFRCNPGDVRLWKNLPDVDVVALHYWVEERMPIRELNEGTNTIRCTRKSVFALTDDVRRRYAKYYVDNVFEALSEPGQWYLDRIDGVIYYLPFDDEDPESSEAYAPTTPRLLELIGSPEDNRFVEFLCFEGLTFRHSEWVQPSGGMGTFDETTAQLAASAQAAYQVDGALCLTGARNCSLEECCIEHVGGYGVELGDGCRGVRVVGCTIRDMGAGGIKINGADADGPVSRRTGGSRITDNEIGDGGHVFPSGVGILLRHTYGNDISHNHVHDLFYTGISCGWVWGFEENVSRDNIIEKNHIHDLGRKLLSDLGGIYTLGVQPGTILRGNLIHDVWQWNYGGWCIYLDEGSSHILVEGNVCYNAGSQPFRQHYGRENVVRNNIFAFGAEAQVGPHRPLDHVAYTFERNIVVSDGKPFFLGDAKEGYDRRLERQRLISDLNLFWDVSGSSVCCADMVRDDDARQVITHSYTFSEWQALGHDAHSLVIDPGFADARSFCFSLSEKSPAFGLGFRRIDVSDAKPRHQHDLTDVTSGDLKVQA